MSWLSRITDLICKKLLNKEDRCQHNTAGYFCHEKEKNYVLYLQVLYMFLRQFFY